MKRRVDDSLAAVTGLSNANSMQNNMRHETENVFKEILDRMDGVKVKSFTVTEGIKDVQRVNREIALEGRKVTSNLIDTSADMEKYKV